jgi:hypothetical protein
VVIDEEQRFGVLHKEKFKRCARMVDVLTLSATPIPRTLYLALTGARDMSTIETPPQDRLPVETIVTEYDERVIRDAIQREMNRGGQVFFLHNRVMTIESMRAEAAALVPRRASWSAMARWTPDDLEEVMTEFINGEADVLLSTTIIESGLDIPNANTIIIDRADRFGLSELYQLRGRVGRYKHQAYAYLLCRAMRACSPTPASASTPSAILHARQRLQDRHARPGDSRRRQSARRRTERPHHGGRLRALLPVAEEVRALLLITEIRVRAEQKRILSVETEGNRLKCLRDSGRRDDYCMLSGRFPRLTAPTAQKRLREICTFLNNLPTP